MITCLNGFAQNFKHKDNWGDIWSLDGLYLAIARRRIESGEKIGNLLWNEILDCEVWEATEAIYERDYAHAVEELYDCVAVLLRTIDVLEGRQKLGSPKRGDAERR